LIILQSISGSGQTCVLGSVDIGREAPKRHSLGNRETFSDLGRRHGSLDSKCFTFGRRDPADIKSRIVEPPISALKRCALGLDAILKTSRRVEPKDAHAA